MKLRKRSLVAIFVVVNLALTGAGQRTPQRVGQSVRDRWFKQHSFYAFLEIFDTELDPDWSPRGPGATKQHVMRALGSPTCAGPGCYPNFTSSNWLYSTERRIPVQNRAILSFDERGILKSIDWVSE